MIILNEIHQYICEIEKNKLDEWLEENKKIVIEQDEDKALVKNAYQAGFVSIVEVIVRGGWEYSKPVAWRVGRAMSKIWREEMQQPPKYMMLAKTFGKVNQAPKHLKAVYPDSWIPDIVKVIHAMYGEPTHSSDPTIPSPPANENPNQLRLFKETP